MSARTAPLWIAGLVLLVGAAQYAGFFDLKRRTETPTPFPDDATTRCKSCVEGDWCDRCDAGTLAGVRVPSRRLLEYLDAHGHDLKPEELQRESCRTRARGEESSEFCDRCRMGFVDGRAYLSKLAFYAARAEKRTSPLECRHCLASRDEPRWCERCGVGRNGDRVWRRKADFDVVHSELTKLRRALKELPRFETCAIATMSGGRCRRCASDGSTTGSRKSNDR
ncbi:MAG: hypothetical protein AAF517_11110 [Planctomycetota bacterium]